MKILFLDLDGTIREPLSGATFINHPRDQKIIEGADQAIKQYSDWMIIGITNQGGVAAGHKTLEDALKEQHYTLELFPEINVIYMAHTYDGLQCYKIPRNKILNSYREIIIRQRSIEEYGSFRKPGKGMIEVGLNNARLTTTETIEEVLMIGDREEDEQAAQAAGIKFMWANEWRNQ